MSSGKKQKVLHAKLTGFTIVELLIVIVVISILAAITVVSFSGINARANDSVRAQHIQAYQKALSMALTLDGELPVSAIAYIGSSGYGAGAFSSAIIDKGYLPERLLDPAHSDGHNTNGYLYKNSSSSHSFILGDDDSSTYAIRFISERPPASGSAFSCLTSTGIYQAGTQPGATNTNQCVEK